MGGGGGEMGRDQMGQMGQMSRDQISQMGQMGRDQMGQMSQMSRDQISQMSQMSRDQMGQMMGGGMGGGGGSLMLTHLPPLGQHSQRPTGYSQLPAAMARNGGDGSTAGTPPSGELRSSCDL